MNPHWKSILQSLVVAAVLLIAFVGSAIDAPADTNALLQVSQSLKTADNKHAKALVAAEQRRAAIEECLGIFNDGLLEERLAAAKTLGQLRAKEAVLPLIENIDLQDPSVLEKSYETSYPVTSALVEIGYDSVREIRSRVGLEMNELRVKLMLLVVKRVLAPDDAAIELNRILYANAGERARLESVAAGLGLPITDSNDR